MDEDEFELDIQAFMKACASGDVDMVAAVKGTPFERVKEAKSGAQHSPEWFAARLGNATASRIADVIAKTRTGYGAARSKYAIELATERMTGKPIEVFVSRDMQWGTDTEPTARERYSDVAGATVKECGMIPHPTINNSGASPDGLVGRVGLLEIKCPRTTTMVDTVLSGEIPARYQAQMNWQLACTKRKWCDFVMFDPRLPEHSQIWIKRHHRDDEVIAQLEDEVAGFLIEVESMTSRFLEAVK